MKTYRIYQIPSDRGARDDINENGWGALKNHPAQEAYQNLMMGADKYEEKYNVYFQHVANIAAESVEDVFTVGNVGPDNQIERLTELNMRSVSIGDVVVDCDTGRCFMIDSFGYERIVFSLSMARGAV